MPSKEDLRIILINLLIGKFNLGNVELNCDAK